MEKYLTLHHRSILTGMILVTGFILLIFFLKAILGILLLLYLSIILSEGLRPIIADLEKIGVPKTLAALLVFISLLFLLLFTLWLFISPLIDQLQSLYNQIPAYTTKAQDFLSQDQFIKDNQVFSALKNQLGEISKSIAINVISVPKHIFNFFFNVVMVFFLSYFWLSGSLRFEKFFLKWFPSYEHELIKDVFREIGANIGSYLRGVLVMMILIGLVSGIGVWLLGLPYALVLGLIAGLTEAIPIIGPFVGAVPAIIIALFISPITALSVAIFYLVVQQLEGNILVPAIMNRILKLESLVILISVLVGTTLLGVLGAFLAVPTASIIQTVLNRLILPRLRS